MWLPPETKYLPRIPQQLRKTVREGDGGLIIWGFRQVCGGGGEGRMSAGLEKLGRQGGGLYLFVGSPAGRLPIATLTTGAQSSAVEGLLHLSPQLNLAVE